MYFPLINCVVENNRMEGVMPGTPIRRALVRPISVLRVKKTFADFYLKTTPISYKTLTGGVMQLFKRQVNFKKVC